MALAANLVVIVQAGILTRSTGFAFAVFPDRTVNWTSYEEVFAWLRDHSEPSDRIASALDSMVLPGTLIGRRSGLTATTPSDCSTRVRAPRAGPPAKCSNDELERSQVPRMFPIPGFEAELPFGEVVREIRRDFPARLVPRFVGHDPRFMVFEVR